MNQMVNKEYQQRVQRHLAINEGSVMQNRVKELLVYEDSSY
jgi:hypothetical protein